MKFKRGDRIATKYYHHVYKIINQHPGGEFDVKSEADGAVFFKLKLPSYEWEKIINVKNHPHTDVFK